MKMGRLLIVLCLLLSLGQCAFYWSRLPPVMASHFGANGQPNGWQSKTAFFGFDLFIVLLLASLFLGMPLLLRYLPVSMINLPHKNYWLAPERREESFTYLTGHMEWMAVASLALLVIIVQMVIVTNLSGAPVLPSAPAWLVMGGYFVFVFVWMTKLLRRFPKAG